MDEITLAKQLFNETWDLIDKQTWNDEEKITMLHKAHASCLLWRTANNPVNNARGEWQVSRVYCLLEMGVPALLHAQACLKLTLDNGMGGFDLPFAYEAVGRAQKVLGNDEQAQEYVQLGLKACEAIAEDGERKYVEGELNSVFGERTKPHTATNL